MLPNTEIYYTLSHLENVCGVSERVKACQSQEEQYSKIFHNGQTLNTDATYITCQQNVILQRVSVVKQDDYTRGTTVRDMGG
mgnify:CR=1 FL=1